MDAFRSALTGTILVVVFYVLLLPVMYATARYFLKDDGLGSIAVTSVAGMSVSVPAVLIATNPEVSEFVAPATAPIAFAVVITSIITPFLAKKLMERKGKNQKHVQIKEKTTEVE